MEWNIMKKIIKHRLMLGMHRLIRIWGSFSIRLFIQLFKRTPIYDIPELPVAFGVHIGSVALAKPVLKCSCWKDTPPTHTFSLWNWVNAYQVWHWFKIMMTSLFQDHALRHFMPALLPGGNSTPRFHYFN